jgi:YVTN family beta-propeller protein
MFVTAETGNAVTVVDVASHKVTQTITLPASPGAPTPPRPMGGVLAPDSRQLFVSNGRAMSVSIIDVASRSLVRMIENVGTRPWGIGISADGRKLFTANGPSGDVSIVDVAAGTVDRRVELGGSPWGIAVAAGSK